MRLIARARSLWWNLARRNRVERELDEELSSYVDLLSQDYERAGLSPEHARRRAILESGGIAQVKEATRDARAGDALATLARDLRYALRTLRRSPGFFIIATVVLGIGIGGATAVFTVIKGSLLRPLPAVPEPHQLVSIERVQSDGSMTEVSYPDYQDFRNGSTSLAGLAGFDGTSMPLTNATGTEREWVSFVTDDFFAVLGVRPVAGRVFTPADSINADAGAARVVVIGYELWQRRFGGAASAIGASITLDDHAFTVIGVAPPRFIGAMATNTMDAWAPIRIGTYTSPITEGFNLVSRRAPTMRLVGRLVPRKTVEDARRELTTKADYLAATHPVNRGRGVRVWSGAGMTTEERVDASRVPRLLALAVGLLLLIACGNVASLSLIRVAGRRRELATRVALGASRARLIRQVVLEGTVVAAAAAALGIGVAVLLVRSTSLVDAVISMEDMDLAIDLRVLAVALVASTLTSALISVAPAIHAARLPPGAVLKDGAGAGRRRSLGQRVLVGAQVAASLVLLSAAATIFATFTRVLATHRATDPQALTDVRVTPPKSLAAPAQQLAFYRALVAQAASEPGVESVTLASTVPPFQWSRRVSVFRRGEEPSRAALAGRELELGIRVLMTDVSESFFHVMRIPLLLGRGFAPSDDLASEAVTIVNRRLADMLWPERDPIGQVIAWPSVEGRERPPLRVVGVAGDTRDVTLAADPQPAMYVPHAQHPSGSLLLIVRGRAGQTVSANDVRRIVTAVDPWAVALGGRTLLERILEALRPQRRASVGIAVFGLIALLIASIGLYGVVAQSVLQRTRELAIRAALGATPRGILGTVLRDAARPAVVGILAGMVASAVAVPVLRSLFAGVRAADARLTLVGVAVLGIALLTAALVPARRAARFSPADALRSD
jgi:predicted permease